MMKINIQTRTTKQRQNNLLLTNKYNMKKVKYRDKIYNIELKTFIVIIHILIISGINGQIRDQRERFTLNGAPNEYQWPNPGDPNYRTYIFNGRRYGHYQPNYSSQYQNDNVPGGRRYPIGHTNIDPFQNLPHNGDILFPGVLAGWREDLQGKQRRDSLTLERDVFVTTNYGEIQGFKVYMYDNPDPKSFYRPYHSTVDRVMGECSVFLGIPYAMPPTQEGRFKPPRLHRGWQLLQAVDYGPACPQPLRYIGATKGVNDMDEDCLYLNVFSPKTGAGVAQKYPVMVYIHGGNFIHGASNLFQGHILASFYEVIVVTFNYRLGALGFLSTGDENSPGNYGILDQIMALKWVYDNIEFFNGDRELITLFGPDAGAASSGLLMLAPETQHIVRRVIAQSGSVLADWALIQDKYRAQNTSRVLGQVLGCSIDSSWKLVNCLRTRNPFDLGEAEFPPDVGTFPWGPVLDHNFTVPGDDWYDGWREKDWHFLSETPLSLLDKGSFKQDIQYMTGVTTQEAAFFISQNESLAPYYEISEIFFHEKIKELVFRYNYTLNPAGVYEAIKYMYTYWPDPNNSTILRDQYIKMLSDFYYAAPVDQLIKILLEKRVPIYMYVMNTTVEALNLPEWRKYPHNIEHYFLNGAPFMDIEFFPKSAHLQRNMWTDNDRNMSHFFLKTFSNFARYGNPTPQQVLGIHFEQAYQGELRYLNINTTFNSSIKLNYRQTECAFWTQYLPTVIGVLIPTYPPTTEYWWEPKEPLQIAFWSMSVACFILIVMVVICCIMWRNAKRQSDRYYDEDAFIDPSSTEYEQDLRTSGVENVHQGVHLSQDNVYEYRDSPSTKTLASKMIAETASSSLRSPSSLGMIQKSESQSSIKSIISLKESSGGGTASTYTATATRTHQQSDTTSGRLPTNGNIILAPQAKLTSSDSNDQQLKQREPIILSSTAIKSKTRQHSMANTLATTAPIPTTRTYLSSQPTQTTHTYNTRGGPQPKVQVRTQVIEGIPQTSV